jgi:hypothetical protein
LFNLLYSYHIYSCIQDNFLFGKSLLQNGNYIDKNFMDFLGYLYTQDSLWHFDHKKNIYSHMEDILQCMKDFRSVSICRHNCLINFGFRDYMKYSLMLLLSNCHIFLHRFDIIVNHFRNNGLRNYKNWINYDYLVNMKNSFLWNSHILDIYSHIQYINFGYLDFQSNGYYNYKNLRCFLILR